MQGVKCRYNNTFAIEKAYSVKDFPWNTLPTLPTVGKRFLSDFITFDIETSKIEQTVQDELQHTGFMYKWQACIFGKVIIDNTWESFFEMLDILEKRLNLYIEPEKEEKVTRRKNRKGRILVIYVHNLSFEFQFLYSFFNKEDMEVFAIDSHKVIKFNLKDIFEFRCSYFLSNMTLDKFITNYPFTSHFKMKDDLDYSIVRTPATKLTMTELGYCYNDVKGLYEAVHGLMLIENVNLATIQLTSTGFVRTDCRNNMRKDKKWHQRFIKDSLSLDRYKLCQDCFRGGNTSGNRYFVGVIIENVKSKDVASSYPYAIMSKEYPSGPFMTANPSDKETLLAYNNRFCTMGRYLFINLRIKKDVPIPYIPFSKCIRINTFENFNGRVLKAKELYIGLTNIDFKILDSQYEYDELYVYDFCFAYKKMLPKELRETVLHYFELKTQLKGVDGKEYEYMKSKNKLNAIYGMMVTNILRPEITIDFDTGEWEETGISRGLEDYYKSWNNFLSYQWGIFVTAYAREHLQKLIDIVGFDTVYVDTDSNKYFGDHDEEIEQLNKEILKELNELDVKPIVKKDGKIYAMGLYEEDASYDKFITLGAKKYAYEKDGKIGVTVAGLSKIQGAKELEKMGGLEHFKIDTVFHDSGRTVAYYNHDKPHYITVNDDTFLTGSNIAIVDTTYRLGITDTMLSFLLDLHSEDEFELYGKR